MSFLDYLFNKGIINRTQFSVFRHVEDLYFREFLIHCNIVDIRTLNMKWREFLKGGGNGNNKGHKDT